MAHEVEQRDASVELGLEVRVQDNGSGFEAAAKTSVRGSDGGFGLIGMRERAEMLGGFFEMDSAPGRGTVVRTRLPLDTQEDLSE